MKNKEELKNKEKHGIHKNHAAKHLGKGDAWLQKNIFSYRNNSLSLFTYWNKSLSLAASFSPRASSFSATTLPSESRRYIVGTAFTL